MREASIVREGVKVERIITEHGRAVGVEYRIDGSDDVGEIRADAVVNAAGMWGRELGDQAGAVVPLHAAEHFYIVTEGVEGISPTMPVLRDPDGCGYFKEDAGKLLVGWFEPVAKPWGMPRPGGGSGIPESFCFDSLPADFEHIAPLMESAANRMPLIAEAGIRLFFNGPEAFTPDDRYLLGESPDVKGLFMACGFNSIGIQSSGGAGKVLADWIIDGHPPMDLWDVDIRRVMPFQRNQQLPARPHRRSARSAVRDALAVPSARDSARRAPIGAARSARRAAGVLRRGRRLGARQLVRPGGCRTRLRVHLRQAELVPVLGAAEHRAVRDGGRPVRPVVVRQVPVARAPTPRRCSTGSAPTTSPCRWARLVYTQWLNERGTIEADLTVTREAADRFLIVTAAATQVRDFA